VDLNRVSAEPGFLYDQTVYHCAYLKDSGMIGKVSIFASGKIISIGTKSFRSAKHDLYHAQQKLTDLGLIEHARIKVVLRNLVATGEIGKTVDIQKLVKLPNVIYEPEQFPGAIYHAAELEGASMLIFANGKIVLAGLRSEYSLEVSKRIITQLALLAVT